MASGMVWDHFRIGENLEISAELVCSCGIFPQPELSTTSTPRQQPIAPGDPTPRTSPALHTGQWIHCWMCGRLSRLAVRDWSMDIHEGVHANRNFR
ncbi:hypothetical protein BS50DRAFT_84008 [Corynespora cassiicola Philippines]|uniref:Uncharacterized protein n=1 Tax=Corynespora cassiicola Philippines TaxID=1448308 RepID=A0A2T2NDR1_CORCC|nr:hypothetical protein BS50DRAFT_84008 [Corynespora cassiicola Philippines]